jgi:Ca2+-binding RTX toxin-like protein
MKSEVTISEDFTNYRIDSAPFRFIFAPGHQGSGGSGPAISITARSSGIEAIIQNHLTTTSSYGIESAAAGTLIQIDQSGMIDGLQGIHLLGDNQIVENDGTIDNSYVAMKIDASGANIANNGSIAAPYAFSIADATAHTTIANNGEIHVTTMVAFVEGDDVTFKLGEKSVITVDDGGMGFSLNSISASDIAHLTNAGSISAPTAITGGSGREIIKNTGTIHGDIQLGDGNDAFNNATGVFTGTVDGGGGNDVYTLGSVPINIVDGAGGGTDVVRSTNSVSLMDTEFTGVEIENISLLAKNNVNASGNQLNNVIAGNSGNNTLEGLEGFDILRGGKGKDRLYGGTDADTFMFKTGDTGKTHASADTIYDFTSADSIDLTTWDANSKRAGVQDFSFIGSHAFSGQAGQLHVVHAKSDTWIEGDTNGDKKADFVVHLDDAVTIKAGNFDL